MPPDTCPECHDYGVINAVGTPCKCCEYAKKVKTAFAERCVQIYVANYPFMKSELLYFCIQDAINLALAEEEKKQEPTQPDAFAIAAVEEYRKLRGYDGELTDEGQQYVLRMARARLGRRA